MGKKILVIDDEESIRLTFQIFLTDEGYTVRLAGSYTHAQRILSKEVFDLIYLELVLGDRSGLELLKSVGSKIAPVPVIVITGAPSYETVSEAMHHGALDYLVKPVRQDALLQSARLGLKHRALAREKEALKHHLQAVFTSVKDSILTTDQNLQLTSANLAAQTMCGIDPETSLGISLDALMKPCRRCVDALKKTIAEKRAVEIERVACHSAKGPERIVSICATPLLDQPGDLTGGVLVIRDHTRLHHLERVLSGHLNVFKDFVGDSPPMRQLRQLIRDLAGVDTTVLITGRSGTGKEVVADALHAVSHRKDRPMVRVNCAALADDVLESELFGHVQGAFTGAVRDRKGRFEHADRGTLFLDEIGDISPKVQLRLLRVIENGEFEKVGRSDPEHVDVKIITATNQDLKNMVREGRFREDLYYRLNVVHLRLPPLCDRPEDIPLLVKHFLARLAIKFDKPLDGVTEVVMNLLTHYHWPGNVRELENALEYAAALCRQPTISRSDLPRDLQHPGKYAAFHVGRGPGGEVSRIRQALIAADGNKAMAARSLGISRRTIYRKIDKYGIDPKP